LSAVYEFDLSNRLFVLEQHKEWKMKIKIKCLLFVFFATMCLPVIAMAQIASYNYAQGVNFAQYKSYEWVNIEGAGVSDSFLDNDIKRAIDAQLAAKGLTKSNQGAQLYVAYQVSFPWEKQITQYGSGGYWGYGPGWRYGYSHGYSYLGSAMSTTTNSPIQLGSMVLDIYDSSYKDLVWRGIVSGTIGPDRKGNSLIKSVAMLLKRFPPKK
jgi:hypothetical protein